MWTIQWFQYMRILNRNLELVTASSLDTFTSMLGANEATLRRAKKRMAKKNKPKEVISTARSNPKMTQIHIVLQPKGGVGKSVVASLISQHLKSKGQPFIAIDTDPNNATLSGYKALNVQRLEVMKNGSIIERNFDALVEQVLTEKDNSFVIDNGSSNFSPFLSYMKKNKVVEVINSEGKQVYIHTVIKGGQEVKVTLAGFKVLAEHTPPEAKIIVWLNEFISEVKGDGKTFQEMKVYKSNKERVNGIVRLEHQGNTLHGQDMRQMLDASLVFDEVQGSPDFSNMAQRRLNDIKDDIFSQLEVAIK